VRNGTLAAQRRTQSSIAVSANGEDWLLVNASPDLLAQIAAHPELQPARRVRDSGIAAVITMDAQIDHVTGLLMLRERDTPLPLYVTDAVLQDLSTGLPVVSILAHTAASNAMLFRSMERRLLFPRCRASALKRCRSRARRRPTRRIAKHRNAATTSG
jgi:coenzyme PQQ biosynthesis protein B